MKTKNSSIRKGSFSMFWGFFFLIVGLLIILQTVLKIDLPILSILFGCLLVYWGMSIILGSFGLKHTGFKVNKVQTESEAVFSESQFEAKSAEGNVRRTFLTVFGSADLDLSGLTEADLAKPIRMTSVFGEIRIKTNPEHAVRADISTVFGEVNLRDQKFSSLGNQSVLSSNFSETKPFLDLKVSSVFGNVKIF